ncbi:hypothetical protein AVEN_139711-1 [Araneus ventricosus]|uniref:Uncharacterized protein n=1 Tax=Araneus ventricosus TaxID=182803 RepID=A0A4Y2LKQ1_ARAVE|nr:hypothetical protein AVEN_139711-1 [Araneus ventricosus]
MEFGRREEDSTTRTRRPETREEEIETRLNSEADSDSNFDSHYHTCLQEILVFPMLTQQCLLPNQKLQITFVESTTRRVNSLTLNGHSSELI